MRPPRLARPLNATVAIVAPRASSSPQTASQLSSSLRPGRSLASWIREASRPDGVRHGSPAVALHVGHVRARHPARHVEPRGWPRLAVVRRATARPGGRAACRTPLLEPQRAIAHHASCRRSASRPCSSAQSPSGGLGGPPPAARGGPVSALEFRKESGGVQRVHSASTRSTSTVNRPSQPYTPYCGCLQGFSTRLRASVNARKTLTLPW